MLRKVLVWFLVSISCGSAFLIFVRIVTDPEPKKEASEPVAESMLRVYQNFLHRTRSNYEVILQNGTDYTNQDKVFIQLTEKMQKLNEHTPEYETVKAQFVREIQKNDIAFQVFFQKVSRATPEEMSQILQRIRSEADKHNKAINDAASQ
jgi:hypothetical protein